MATATKVLASLREQGWMQAQQDRLATVLASGRLPMMPASWPPTMSSIWTSCWSSACSACSTGLAPLVG
jgi:hypothetical protein